MTERDPPPIRTFRPKDPDAISLSALLGLEVEVPVALPPVIDTGVVREIGGRKEGLDPTRYGDWEKNGRCIDF
ncbi:MAG: DUF1674 domain-containing protein [Panacagrimonas sp.]